MRSVAYLPMRNTGWGGGGEGIDIKPSRRMWFNARHPRCFKCIRITELTSNSTHNNLHKKGKKKQHSHLSFADNSIKPAAFFHGIRNFDVFTPINKFF